MPSVLSERGVHLLGDLPPYLADDPWVQTIVDVMAREWGRIEDAVRAVQERSRPQNAADDYGFLMIWETLLGLPVAPVGVPLSQRQSKVLAQIRQRNVGAASQWIAILTEALGSTVWTHQEGPGPYQVTINMPTASGTYTAETTVRLARKVTPAHLDIAISYGEGFIIEDSLIGQQPL